MISRDWRAGPAGETAMDRMTKLPVQEQFDFSAEIGRMRSTWKPRGEGGLHGFARETGRTLAVIPDRSFGIV